MKSLKESLKESLFYQDGFDIYPDNSVYREKVMVGGRINFNTVAKQVCRWFVREQDHDFINELQIAIESLYELISKEYPKYKKQVLEYKNYSYQHQEVIDGPHGKTYCLKKDKDEFTKDMQILRDPSVYMFFTGDRRNYKKDFFVYHADKNEWERIS